ncbi:MAG: hypothetical protein IT182_14465 [Acidobacteria bacterium]|nr:hypothetical protein [Acidobacteriota bacterium]
MAQDEGWGLARISKLALIVGVLAGGYVTCVTSARKALIAGNEASAIGSLRSIGTAQTTYSATECTGRYAPTLTSLGAKGLLSSDLTVADTIERGGYRIAMSVPAQPTASGQSPACADSVTAFTATAVPLDPGTSGVRYFITDGSNEVRQATDESFSDAAPVR